MEKSSRVRVLEFISLRSPLTLFHFRDKRWRKHLRLRVLPRGTCKNFVLSCFS